MSKKDKNKQHDVSDLHLAHEQVDELLENSARFLSDEDQVGIFTEPSISVKETKSLLEDVLAHTGDKHLQYVYTFPLALKTLADTISYYLNKDPDADWFKGREYSYYVKNLTYYLQKFLELEDVDSTSGIDNLGHVICNVMMLAELHARKLYRFDDRSSTLPKHNSTLDIPVRDRQKISEE